MRSNGALVAAIEEVRAPLELVCRSHEELWSWCEMGSGRDGTDIRGGLLVCTGIREKSVLCEWDVPMCTYFREKKKESQGDLLPNLATELDHVKPAVWCASVTFGTVPQQRTSACHGILLDLKVPVVKKKKWTYGNNKKKVRPGCFLTLIWKDLDR